MADRPRPARGPPRARRHRAGGHDLPAARDRELAGVAATDPAIFRRRGRPDTAAAAITWVVARANHAFDSYHGGLTAKALLAWFGLSGSVSQRARTPLRAVGVDLHASADLRLGTTRYLVSAERGRIIDTRDRWAAAQG